MKNNIKKTTFIFSLLLIPILLLLDINDKPIEPQTEQFLGANISSTENFNTLVDINNLSEGNIAENVIFENSKMFYDKNNDLYYISVSELGNSKFNDYDILDIYWFEDEIDNFYQKIAENYTFKLGIVMNNSKYQIINLKVTNLPVINIECAEVPSKHSSHYYNGIATIFNNFDSETNVSKVDSSYMRFKVRGGTSRLYDKNNFKMELLTVDGSSKKENFLGMRNDDDWILTANYGDYSKLRYSISCDILDLIAKTSTENKLHAQKGEFCELFINDCYWGIYLLNEQVDAKLLELNKSTDFLYDSDGNILPTIEELEAKNKLTPQQDYVTTVHPKYFPSEQAGSRYDSFIEYLKLLNTPVDELDYEYIKEKLSIDNMIDGAIFLMVVSGVDNDPKNMKLVSRQNEDNSYTIYKEFFDFNLTFGDTWGDTEANNTTPILDDTIVFSEMSQKLINYPEFATQFKERYHELRDSILSEENIIDIVDKRFAEVNSSGAYYREMDRWNLSYDVDSEYNRIINYVKNQLIILDNFVNDI